MPVLSKPFIPVPPPPALVEGSIFNDTRRKLWRAICHVHDISYFFTQAVKEAAPRLDKFIPTGEGDYGYQPNVMVPYNATLSLSDAIRNLRSSLDYIPSAMARAAGVDDSSILFPFAETKTQLEQSFNGSAKARRSKAMAELSGHYPGLAELILTEVQPYSAEDGAKITGDLLWRLVTMDNIDKHRVLTPVVQPVTAKHATFISPSGATIHLGDVQIIGLFTGKFWALACPEPMKLTEESRLELDFVYGNETRLAGQSIFDTLVTGAQTISDLINEFEKLVAARKAP